jgi:hypothetical protein
MALFFGAGISGAFGYGAYRCFNSFSRETAKSDAERLRLQNSIVHFNDRLKLGQSTGIVTFIPKKCTFFDIYKEHIEQDLSLKQVSGYDMSTGRQSTFAVPVVVNSVVKTHLNSFISNPTFGSPNIIAGVIPNYMFYKRPTILQCSGFHLTSYFKEKHGMTVMLGNHNSFQINETNLDDMPLYLFGHNTDDNKFQYTRVSDDRGKLIEKEIAANDNSGEYLLGGLLCLGGLVGSVVLTIGEINKP